MRHTLQMYDELRLVFLFPWESSDVCVLCMGDKYHRDGVFSVLGQLFSRMKGMLQESKGGNLLDRYYIYS